jgi:hypothetical protein
MTSGTPATGSGTTNTGQNNQGQQQCPLEVHHLFPQEQASYASSIGLVMNSGNNRRDLLVCKHRLRACNSNPPCVFPNGPPGVHTVRRIPANPTVHWNKEWKAFVASLPSVGVVRNERSNMCTKYQI